MVAQIRREDTAITGGYRKMKHELKTLMEPFKHSWAGVKPFEIRINDRQFSINDEVILAEYDPSVDCYTGREIYGFIRYITDFKQQEKYIVFYLEQCGRTE